MKGGINKIIRNVNASVKGKTDFDKVRNQNLIKTNIEIDQGNLPPG